MQVAEGKFQEGYTLTSTYEIFRFLGSAVVIGLIRHLYSSRRERKAVATLPPDSNWEHLEKPSEVQINDLQAIKKEYRDSIKKYHPDTILDPEKKAEYHHKCVELNETYREALNQRRRT